MPSAVDLAVAVWLFATGGAVGSFLNVVVYRLPAGMSLSHPGSHCPNCKHPIRWYDNLPIFGWLVLRGRCRDCRTPISARYPAVEALVAAVFLSLGVLEVFNHGLNLPVRPVLAGDGILLPRLGPGELGGILAYHLLLLSTLVSAALIEFDGHAVPRRLFGPALAVGALAPLVWPHLHPVPLNLHWEGWIAGLADGAAGAAVGLALGAMLGRLAEPKHRFGATAALGCVGLFLGWQAVVAIGVITALLHLAARVLGLRWPFFRRIPPTVWTFTSTFGWVLLWRLAVDGGRLVG